MKDRKKGSCAGFTLIEVLLVVAILGILAGVVVVSVRGRPEKARINAARMQITSLKTAINVYEIDTGRLPPTLQALVSSSGEANWQGPYLDSDTVPLDPWGREISYSLQNNKIKLTIAGPDGNMGSEDDITN